MLNSRDTDGNGIPDEVEDGTRPLVNIFFATGTDRRLYAFDSSGNAPAFFVFDTDGDDEADANVSNQMQNIPTDTRGLAFSVLDFNLWHPTMNRRGDAGHGIVESFDVSRSGPAFPVPSINGRGASQNEGGASFYFGMEQWVSNPSASNAYYTYAGNAQYGVSELSHRNITTNSSIGGNYNLPGGAEGSLVTDSFSLAGSVYADKPTLYFNYFLETENTNASIGASNDSRMRDSARVWISQDGGVSWHLLATNNSTLSSFFADNELPRYKTASSRTGDNYSQQRVQELYDNTGVWRQARVDLGDFAGQSDLILRFDFGTSGRMNNDVNVASGNNINNAGSLTSANRGRNNQHEGFYVDDIIIGYAERGEMVTNAPVIPLDESHFRTVPQNPMPDALAKCRAERISWRSGEERRMPEPATDLRSTIIHGTQFDTNERFIRENDSSYGGSLFAPVGDRNVPRQQDHLQIYGNTIADVSGWGIYVDSQPRDATDNLPRPGSVRNLPTLYNDGSTPVNNRGLVPGVSIVNNIVDGAITGGIFFSGDPNNGNTADAAIPFGRILNNTVYGGASAQGIGIRVTENAGPTILNNIVSNTATGISIDASSNPWTEVDYNLFKGNAANGTVGTNQKILSAAQPLFVDPANRNFYLAAGSEAIDSSQSFLGDRSDIAAVKTDVGIPPSAIKAPRLDRFAQLRADDILTPNTGDGPDPFFDRGAVERIDTAQPWAKLVDPLDNGPIDRADTQDDYVFTTADLSRFEIQLFDTGVGIADLTVDANLGDLLVAPVHVWRNADPTTFPDLGTQLVQGVDYFAVYSPVDDKITLTPAAGFWTPASTYSILLDNTIQDIAGNAISPTTLGGAYANRTVFVVNLGTYDYGDAPDDGSGAYPTLNANDGARHLIDPGYYLGNGVTYEADAYQNATATGDGNDDGISLGPTMLVNQLGDNYIHFTVTASGSGYLDAWIDYDGLDGWEANEKIEVWTDLDGDGFSYDDAPGSEVHYLSGQSIPVSQGLNHFYLVVNSGQISGDLDQTFGRFRFSRTGGLPLTGEAADGEVEDYLLSIVTSLKDYGDAPASYEGNLAVPPASDPAWHVLDPDPSLRARLGADVDYEGTNRPSSDALGDDTADRDDEDGIAFTFGALVAGQDAQIDVTATLPAGGGTYYLQGWIDFDIDDRWADYNDPFEGLVSEHVLVDIPIDLSTGTFSDSFTFHVPAGASQGTSYARFRLSSAMSVVGDPVNGINYFGMAPDGEVEDHAVEIVATAFDFGDAPYNPANAAEPDYPTLLAQDGARHAYVFNSPLRLGAAIDYEQDAILDAGETATGDDSDGVVNDEDGIRIGSLNPSGPRLRQVPRGGKHVGVRDGRRGGVFERLARLGQEWHLERLGGRSGPRAAVGTHHRQPVDRDRVERTSVRAGFRSRRSERRVRVLRRALVAEGGGRRAGGPLSAGRNICKVPLQLGRGPQLRWSGAGRRGGGLSGLHDRGDRLDQRLEV